MTRADRLTLVRQLREEGLSQRAIAKRLKVSKDTVRRDLERITAGSAPGDEPPGEPEGTGEPQAGAAAAPQAASAGAPDDEPPGAPAAPGAPGDEPDGAPPGEPAGTDAPAGAPGGAPVARLPRRMAHARLEMDLSRRPAVRRDLAVLAQSGRSVEQLVSQAVITLAFEYRRALARGQLLPGEAFIVTSLTMRPAPRPEPRPAARPVAGGA